MVRQPAWAAGAALLLVMAAMAPSAARAYEFDMVRRQSRAVVRTGGACGLLLPPPAPLLHRPRCALAASPSNPAIVTVDVPAFAGAVPTAAADPAPLSCAAPTAPASPLHRSIDQQVFQTKCVMEEVNENEEVSGRFNAFSGTSPTSL